MSVLQISVKQGNQISDQGYQISDKARTLIFLGFSCKLYTEGFLDGYALIYEGVNGYQNLSE